MVIEFYNHIYSYEASTFPKGCEMVHWVESTEVAGTIVVKYNVLEKS